MFYSSYNIFPAIDFLVSATALGTKNVNGAGAGEVYPNPVASGNDFTVPFKLTQTGTVNIQVVNVQGQVVRSITRSFGAGENVVNFNTNGLANGVYTYSIIAGEFSANGKVVVK